MKITKDQAIEILLKEHIRRMLKEGEAGNPEEPEVEAEPEPEAEPEAEEEQEVGLSEEMVELTDMYIRRLRGLNEDVKSEDVVEIIARMFDAFNYGNQSKLNILKAVKEETIR